MHAFKTDFINLKLITNESITRIRKVFAAMQY